MASQSTAVSQKIPSCISCYQRKIKCDRNFPCSHCIKAGTQCVPATRHKPIRRRKYSERALLERIRHYEELLRQNGVSFDPLHNVPSSSMAAARRPEMPTGQLSGSSELSPASTNVKSEATFEMKDIWSALTASTSKPAQPGQDEDDSASEASYDGIQEHMIKQAFDKMFSGNDQILFGASLPGIELSTFHPPQPFILSLWQTYLQNVDPLLKVTHTPTLQPLILQASQDIASIEPPLEALMFAIYCMAIGSLDEEECCDMYGTTRQELLSQYQFGCQQALQRAEFLRSYDRHALTALVLYSISIFSRTDPRSIYVLFGMAVRIAVRMGIQDESTNLKSRPFEAEMRRRLWWAMVMYDARVSEMASNKGSTLIPTWDCRLPLNVNDEDLKVDCEALPEPRKSATDAIFLLVRSTHSEYIRNCIFHLRFVNPAYRPLAKPMPNQTGQGGSEVDAAERMLEQEYLVHCNLNDPLQMMTIWSARYHIAKAHLLEHYAKHIHSFEQQTEEELDKALEFTISLLHADAVLSTSPLTRRFSWLLKIYMPFPGYIHAIQDLRKRPGSRHADRAWQVLTDNYANRAHVFAMYSDHKMMRALHKSVLLAAEARVAMLERQNRTEMLPGIVMQVKSTVMQLSSQRRDTASGSSISSPQSVSDIFSTVPSTGSASEPGMFDYSKGFESSGGEPSGFGLEGLPVLPALDSSSSEFDTSFWNTMDWNPLHGFL